MILLMVVASFIGSGGAVPVTHFEAINLDSQATGAVDAAPIRRENMVRRELATAPFPRGHSALQVGARAEMRKPAMPEDLNVAAMLDTEAGQQNLYPATGTVFGQAYYGNAGPKGAKGMLGPQGPVGISGDPGDTGIAAGLTAAYAKFLANTTAFQGQRGPTGPQGIQGDPGDSGVKGFMGQQGPPGLPGSFSPDQEALFKQVVTSMQTAIINMENQHAASQAVLDAKIEAMEEHYNETQEDLVVMQKFLDNVTNKEILTATDAESLQSLLQTTNASLTSFMAQQQVLYKNLQTLYSQELNAANAQAQR